MRSVCLLLLVGLARPTFAQPAPAPAPARPPALDFNLLDDPAAKKAPAADAAKAARDRDFDRKVKRRRSILLWHQGLGFATLVALAATCVIGQLNYQDKYGPGNDDARYYNAHLGLAVSTSALFATTGILALAAPEPYKKPLRADTALAHKVLMAVATAGMAAQLVLGPIAAFREGKLDQRDYALAHLVTSYATFAAMATGVLVYVF